MNNEYTVNQIAEEYDVLTVSFIRKCTKTLKTVLAPHMRKGNYNRIYFDNNGFIIFAEIAKLKRSGRNIKSIEQEIKKQLEHSVQTNKHDKTTIQTNEEIEKLKSQIAEKNAKYNELQREYNEIYKRYTKTLLLTGGKDIDDAIEDARKKESIEKKRVQIQAKLRNIGIIDIFRERKRLLDDLDKLSGIE